MTVEGTPLHAVFANAASAFGHLIEVIEPIDQVTGLYELVASAAKNFDGSNPVRVIDF